MKSFQRLTFFLSILVSPMLLEAQHLAWTSTVVFSGMEYTAQDICPAREELCVGGPNEQLSYSSGSAAMYDGNGNNQLGTSEFYSAGSYMFVYGFDGRLKWNHFFYKDDAVLQNFTYDNNNNLVALVYLLDNDEYLNYRDGDEEEEEDEEDEEKKDVVTKEGYYLWYFDTTGNVNATIRIPALGSVEITDFQSQPSGAFVLAGHASEGKVAANLPLETGPGGSDFILFLHADGKIYAGDVLSYQKESCCSYGARPKVAVDEKGNVFLGGSYMGGAKFGGKVIKLAPVPYNAGRYYNAEEVYVAAYDATGKFLWVNTGGVQSRFTGIAAAKGYVYIACSAWHSGKVFEHELDTADHQQLFVSVFNSGGKFKRNISTGSHGALSLSTDTKGNLYVSGTIGIETGYLKRPESEKGKWRKDDCFIALYGPGGDYKKVFMVDMLKIPSDEPPICMPVNPDLFFLTANLFGSLSIPLSALDKGFPEIKFSSSAPFVGRYKQE